MTKYLPLTIMAMMLLSGIRTANSFVVQERSTALFFDNYARDGTPVSSPSSILTTVGSDHSAASDSASDAGSFAAKSSDNQEIADHLIKPRPNTLDVDLTALTHLNVKIPLGYTLILTLPESGDSHWRIDTDETILKPLRSQRKGEVRYLEFEGAAEGITKLYLDNMVGGNVPPRALESRILRIKVTK